MLAGPHTSPWQAIIEALAQNVGSARVAAAACRALKSLTSSKEHPVPASYHRILITVIDALSHHANMTQAPAQPFRCDVAVITAACGVLFNLAQHPGNQPALHTAGVIPRLRQLKATLALAPEGLVGDSLEASKAAAAVIALLH